MIHVLCIHSLTDGEILEMIINIGKYKDESVEDDTENTSEK